MIIGRGRGDYGINATIEECVCVLPHSIDLVSHRGRGGSWGRWMGMLSPLWRDRLEHTNR